MPARLGAQTSSFILSPLQAKALSCKLRDNCIPMDPVREFGRMMLVAGVVLVVVGGLLAFGARLPFRLGRLPGDIVWQGKGGAFYFPIVTCIVLSVVLSMVVWVVEQLRR